MQSRHGKKVSGVWETWFTLCAVDSVEKTRAVTKWREMSEWFIFFTGRGRLEKEQEDFTAHNLPTHNIPELVSLYDLCFQIKSDQTLVKCAVVSFFYLSLNLICIINCILEICYHHDQHFSFLSFLKYWRPNILPVRVLTCDGVCCWCAGVPVQGVCW